jgi:hypothetical protein
MPWGGARFDRPHGIALDRDGHVIVSDSYNHALRRVTRCGVVSTLAGGSGAGYEVGVGAAACFHEPVGIVVNTQNLWTMYL